MDLRALQETWDALGKQDPFGAILEPLRGTGEWDLEEFFAWGEREIEGVLADGRRLGLPAGFGSALDFGCGAGRLTQAMALHFESCTGVDIAPSMIELARELNRRGERCRYVVNESDSLELFGDSSFDFVYSNITLQHMDPRLSRGYVAELVRVLRPGGMLVFQLPSEADPRSVLPWSALRADVEPLCAELELAPGATATVPVRVRNRGDASWPAQHERRPVRLGNHWLDASGTMLRLDDGRAFLPRDLAPGEQAELSLSVTAPEEPGAYLLELDLVHEAVAWFADRGSPTARVPTRVGPGARATVQPPAPSVSEPARAERRRPRLRRPGRRKPTSEVEMHGVPEPEVRALLETAGARLVEVVENDAAGAGWVSLRYAATKDSA